MHGRGGRREGEYVREGGRREMGERGRERGKEREGRGGEGKEGRGVPLPVVRLLQLGSVVIDQPAWVPGVAGVHQSPSSSPLHLLTTHSISITGMEAKVPAGGCTGVTYLTCVCACVSVCGV